MGEMNPDECGSHFRKNAASYGTYLFHVKQSDAAIRERVSELERSTSVEGSDGRSSTVKAILKQLATSSERDEKKRAEYTKELDELTVATKKRPCDAQTGLSIQRATLQSVTLRYPSF